MHCKAHEARQHKIPKARYQVANWTEYDRSLSNAAV